LRFRAGIERLAHARIDGGNLIAPTTGEPGATACNGCNKRCATHKI